MKTLIIICLSGIIFIGCNKKSENNFDKINVGMKRHDIERLLVNEKKINDGYFKSKKYNYYFSFLNDTLTSITYEPNDLNMKDSTISIGLLDNFTFQTVYNESRLVGCTIGSFSIKYTEITIFDKSLLNHLTTGSSTPKAEGQWDQVSTNLLSLAAGPGYLFRIIGPINSERTSIQAKEVEVLNFNDAGTIALSDSTINLTKFTPKPVIIDNNIYLCYQRNRIK